MLAFKIYGRRPLTKLETGLYAGIVAILMALFVPYVLGFMELAERTAMQSTLMQVTSGMNTRFAYDLLQGKAGDFSALARANPFELARVSPKNFLGETDAAEVATLERGSWFYDVPRGELVYLPRLRTGLHTTDPDSALRFRLEPNGAFGYTLVPSVPYRWE